MQLDEALFYLGNFGRYQTLMFVVVSTAGTVLSAWQMMAMVFIADKPAGYQCRISPSAFSNHSYSPRYSANNSEKLFPDDNSSVVLSDVAECFVNSSGTEDPTASAEWDYRFSYGERTIVSDFDLVCDRAVLANTAQSVFFGGVLVGSLLTGALSDAFGRKTVLIGALLLEGLLGTCLAFVWSYSGFVALWFFVGVFEQGPNIIPFVLIMEMFSPERRTLAGCMNSVAWGLGVASVTPLAYLLRDWRQMQIAISVPNLIAVPLVMWIAVESARWLISKGRMEAAEKVLHRIARLNNIEAPDQFLKDAYDDVVSPVTGETTVRYTPSDINDDTGDDDTGDDDLESNSTGHETGVKIDPLGRPPAVRVTFRFSELVKSPRLFRNAFIMFYSWFVSSVVYYGLFLNSSNLAGDKYLNFLLLALVEIPAYFVVYFLIIRWGRRPTLSLGHFIAGISSVICACVPKTTAGGFNLAPVVLAFAMAGKFCATASFNTNFVYGTEIFPTPIRNMGVGFCSFMARIGAIITPFVVYLADVSPYIPMNVFGLVSVLAAVLVLMLPETANKPLPETLAEGESLARSAAPPCLPSWSYWLAGKRRTDGCGYQPTQGTA